MSLHIEWDPAKAASNLKKHGISFEMAAAVFADPQALTIPDSEHSDIEERWITLGEIGQQRIAVEIHTWRDRDPSRIRIRIISARLATAHENRQYRG
jgi:uncharacterized DUF497 family protein